MNETIGVNLITLNRHHIIFTYIRTYILCIPLHTYGKWPFNEILVSIAGKRQRLPKVLAPAQKQHVSDAKLTTEALANINPNNICMMDIMTFLCYRFSCKHSSSQSVHQRSCQVVVLSNYMLLLFAGK